MRVLVYLNNICYKCIIENSELFFLLFFINPMIDFEVQDISFKIKFVLNFYVSEIVQENIEVKDFGR